METETERPAHVPGYWKWGVKTDTWSFLIKFVSAWKWSIPGKQGTVNLNGINYTFFVPPRWKRLVDGQAYLFTTSARTDKETGEITHLIAVPYSPVIVREGETITPVFRLVGKFKYETDKLSGFRVYRNAGQPNLKKKFMIHLGLTTSAIVVGTVLELYGVVSGVNLIAHEASVLDVEPAAHEVQEVKPYRKFKKPEPKPKAERVRVKPKW